MLGRELQLRPKDIDASAATGFDVVGNLISIRHGITLNNLCTLTAICRRASRTLHSDF